MRRPDARDGDDAENEASLALGRLLERHYPGYMDLGSPHTGVEQGQMVVSLEHYLAHRRTLKDVTARAAREGRIFTGKAGAEQHYRHDGDTSNEWDLVTLERLKDAAGETEALAIVRKVYTPRPASRVSVHTIPGRNAHGLLWPAGAALLSSMGVIYPRYSVAEVAQALRENDPGWSHQFASDLDCIDQYAGCGCEVVVTDPIPDVPALWRALETDRDALWERIRELSGYDLNQPPSPTHSSS